MFKTILSLMLLSVLLTGCSISIEFVTPAPSPTITSTATITATPTQTATPTETATPTWTATPTLTVTPAPTFTRTPTPTLTPTPCPVSYRYDDKVSVTDRRAIEDGIARARDYFRDGSCVLVFAYADLDKLFEQHAQYLHTTLGDPSIVLWKKRMQDYTTIAIATPGAIWIWVSNYWRGISSGARSIATAHEYFHIVQRATSRASSDSAPLWLTEGTADYFAYRLAAQNDLANLDRKRRETMQRTRGIVYPLSSMTTLSGSNTEDYDTPYTFGYLAVEWLTRKYPVELLQTGYWENRAQVSSSRQAFEKTFGVALDDFYREFETYRAQEFPPFCGTMMTTPEPTPRALSLAFNRRLMPGEISFDSIAWSHAPNVPYIFCTQGMQFGLLTDDASYHVVKLPSGGTGWASCGGNCLVLYLLPNTPTGKYTLSIEFPDGRHIEAWFEHTAQK